MAAGAVEEATAPVARERRLRPDILSTRPLGTASSPSLWRAWAGLFLAPQLFSAATAPATGETGITTRQLLAAQEAAADRLSPWG